MDIFKSFDTLLYEGFLHSYSPDNNAVFQMVIRSLAWSEWSENVCMHCLVATSQTLTVPSAEDETKCSLSGEKATESTQLV